MASLNVARWKGLIGYFTILPNTNKVNFKTNGTIYKVPKNDLEDGKYIIPIPFYKGKEAQIVSSNSNGSYTIKVLGVRSGTKYEKLHILNSDIEWFLIDTTNWHYQKRTNALLKYGLKNFELINYVRNL